MYIFYFLSVASLAAAGLVLSCELLGKKINFFFDFSKLTKSYPLFPLILGITVFLIGAFKLAITVSDDGHSIPVVGDFFPAVGGLIGGVLLILFYFRNKNGLEIAESIEIESKSEDDEDEQNKFKKIENYALAYRGIIGLILIAIAIVHLFVPQILFF